MLLDFKYTAVLSSLSNVPNICLVPLCTFARLHTYNLTKANQSQARVQKRAVGNTFSRRYITVIPPVARDVI